MLPDRVSNPGPLTYESGVLPIALRGPANFFRDHQTITVFAIRARGYNLFFVLNSAEHETFPLINVKMPTIIGILTFIGMKSSILGFSELEKY